MAGGAQLGLAEQLVFQHHDQSPATLQAVEAVGVPLRALARGEEAQALAGAG